MSLVVVGSTLLTLLAALEERTGSTARAQATPPCFLVNSSNCGKDEEKRQLC